MNYWFNMFTGYLPAYLLSINVQETEASTWFSPSRVAVCALDGSWITPFDYVDAVFTEDAILLIRSFEELDIDIIDYSGRLLYNTLELDWINEMRFDPHGYGGYDGSTSATSFVYSVNSGYGIINLQNGNIAFIDILTGKAFYTEFVDAQPFIEGFAAVAIRNPRAGHGYSSQLLWGFVNTDLEITISPRFNWASTFLNGKAIFWLPDSTQHVVNTQGEVLFTVPEGYILNFSGDLFILHEIMHEGYEYARLPDIFSSDLKVIPLTEEMRSFHIPYLSYLGNGWHSTSNENGSLLLHVNDEDYFDKVHYFPGVRHISFTDGELIIGLKEHHIGNDFFFSDAVMTIDGKEIVSPKPGLQITPVIQDDKTIAFTANTGLNRFFSHSGHIPRYTLYDTSGNIIIEGNGILVYHESLELYAIQSANHFSWLDKNADLIIAIPLLSSTID